MPAMLQLERILIYLQQNTHSTSKQFQKDSVSCHPPEKTEELSGRK